MRADTTAPDGWEIYTAPDGGAALRRVYAAADGHPWGADATTLVLAELRALRTEVKTLTDALAVVAPLLDEAPELLATVRAVMAGAKRSPQLRMLGIKFPS